MLRHQVLFSPPLIRGDVDELVQRAVGGESYPRPSRGVTLSAEFWDALDFRMRREPALTPEYAEKARELGYALADATT